MSDIQGCDVSHWQRGMDYVKAYSAGLRFVYIKVSQGIAYKDDKALAHNTSARAAGLKTGFYHFLTTDAPQAQYNWMLQCIGDMPCDLAPALDYETVNNTLPSSSTLYTMAILLKNWRNFPVPAIYTNLSTANTRLLNTTTVKWSQFLLWIAQWNVTAPTIPIAWKGQPYYVWQDRVIKGAQAFGVDGDLDHDFWGDKLPFPGEVPPVVDEYQYCGYRSDGKVMCGVVKERC